MQRQPQSTSSRYNNDNDYKRNNSIQQGMMNRKNLFQNQSAPNRFPLQTQTQYRPQHQSQPLTNSNLNVAISSITYGVACLIYDNSTAQVSQCVLSIHQEYINILHIIVNREHSYLLKLNEVKTISNNDFAVTNKLTQISQAYNLKHGSQFGSKVITTAVSSQPLNSSTSNPNPNSRPLNTSSPIRPSSSSITLCLQYFLVLHLISLKDIVLVFKTQAQRDIIYLGLRFFLQQARGYYNKISEYDPFKAESMMLFLSADKDGGNLLDIQEIISIMQDLKINKEKIVLQNDILEINQYLYEKQNFKRPNKASDYQLIPLAFQYLLRFYSMKDELAKYFKDFCPIFKVKNKNHKNTIIDIIKTYQKPLMSAVQLKHFYEDVLQQKKSEEQMQQLIMNFPQYDGQGKEKLQDSHLLSFNNFCNLIFSNKNTILKQRTLYDQDPEQPTPQKKQQSANKSSPAESAASRLTRRLSFSSGSNISSHLMNQNSSGNGVPPSSSQPQHQISPSGKQYIPLRKKNRLDYPLLDYHIYTDLSAKNLNPNSSKQSLSSSKENPLHLALKRGCKCVKLYMQKSSSKKLDGQAIVKLLSPEEVSSSSSSSSAAKQQFLFEETLKEIKFNAFQKNNLPFWILLQINAAGLSEKGLNSINNAIEEVLGESVYYLQQEKLQHEKDANKGMTSSGKDNAAIAAASLLKGKMPTPNQLRGRFILISSVSFKASALQFKHTTQPHPSSNNNGNKMSSSLNGEGISIGMGKGTNKMQQLPQSLQVKLLVNPVKLDFERKGQTQWDICFLEESQLKDYELAEEQNICNYAKKLFLFSSLRDKSGFQKINSPKQLQHDPVLAMRLGVQFIGLNFQRNMQNNYLMHSKFMQTHQSEFGYLLKPKFMLSQNRAPLYSNKDFLKALYKMTFNIISGQKIIINEVHDTKTFFIECTLKGTKLQDQKNKLFKSKKCTEGFYTQINLQCQFIVYCEETATVVITVKNEQNRIVSGRAISIKNMREGLRSVGLLGERMQKGENSALLVLYKKKLIKQQRAKKMMEFLK